MSASVGRVGRVGTRLTESHHDLASVTLLIAGSSRPVPLL